MDFDLTDIALKTAARPTSDARPYERSLRLFPRGADAAPLPGLAAVRVARDDEQVRALVQGGLPIAEVVLRRTAPKATQLALFGD